MKKITKIWLFGGLGNQLFQLNYGGYLNAVHDYEIQYINNLKKYNILTHCLKWSIHDNILQRITNTVEYEETSVFSKIFVPLLAKAPALNSYSFFHGVSEWSTQPARNNFGYFQSKELLKNRNYVSLKSELTFNCDNDNWLLHYRTLDAGGISHHKNYYDYYYNEVLSSLRPSIFDVVSNSTQSLQKLKKAYPKHEYNDVSSNTYNDFVKILSAKKLIMGPSTFSWWGARLGRVTDLIMPASLDVSLGKPKMDCHVELF